MSRKEFTKPVKRDALKRSGNLCEASGALYGLENGQRCNAALSGGVEFDHVVRACDGGDNSLSNCAAVCKVCHATKTAKFDIPQAAKGKRMSDKASGIKAPKQKIAGRGFPAPDKPAKAGKTPLPPRRMFAPVGALWTQPRWNEDRDNGTD
jgi:hypothetical protein